MSHPAEGFLACPLNGGGHWEAKQCVEVLFFFVRHCRCKIPNKDKAACQLCKQQLPYSSRTTNLSVIRWPDTRNDS